MFDARARRLLDPLLETMARQIVKRGIGANTVTYCAFGVGVLAALAIAGEYYLSGLILLLLSRIGDGLDGAVAGQTKKTDFGGYLDIVLDFIFYGLIPLAFIIANPAQNAVAGAVLIVSFIATGSSFLTFAIMAEKYGMDIKGRRSKSLYYAVGLAEATETIVVFMLFCLFPSWFSPIAWAYSAICIITVIARIAQARDAFKD